MVCCLYDVVQDADFLIKIRVRRVHQMGRLPRSVHGTLCRLWSWASVNERVLWPECACSLAILTITHSAVVGWPSVASA